MACERRVTPDTFPSHLSASGTGHSDIAGALLPPVVHLVLPGACPGFTPWSIVKKENWGFEEAR